MMLYSVYYYSASTGTMLAGFDRDTLGIGRAPKGELAKMVNSNWDGHVYWVDDQGRCNEETPAVIQAVEDEAARQFVLNRLTIDDFADADQETRQLWLDTVRAAANDPARIADIRRVADMAQRRQKVTLYARAS